MQANFKPKLIASLIALAISAPASVSALAADQELNLYSARHYKTDDALYKNFTDTTGIKINRIEGKETELMERLKREGAASPADVFITVDAANLQAADAAGLFAPVTSKLLDERIPSQFRAQDNAWFGFAYRARVITYDKNKVKPEQIANYLDLAKPEFKGKVCVRSGSHPYNLTLTASIINHHGEAKALQWAEGIVANLARAPKGGDTDQMRAIAAGECEVALTNHYYYARLASSDKPEDKSVIEKVGILFPDQKTQGTHVNISGGGMLKHAPHKEAAVKFMEYLASDSAQAYFANGNNEWPVVASVKIDNPQLDALGSFKIDPLNASALAKEIPLAQRLIDKAGWK
ncbi:MAG: Fe(3+) ABC transporter substrate-binding protein [Halothiobacillaceae bacterium]